MKISVNSTELATYPRPSVLVNVLVKAQRWLIERRWRVVTTTSLNPKRDGNIEVSGEDGNRPAEYWVIRTAEVKGEEATDI